MGNLPQKMCLFFWAYFILIAKRNKVFKLNFFDEKGLELKKILLQSCFLVPLHLPGSHLLGSHLPGSHLPGSHLNVMQL
jgi:hypothetical protein